MKADSAPALRVSDLRKTYGERDVLAGVSFDVARGEIRGLLGANGAGKSTLIGCLSGAVKPSGGAIEVGGHRHSALTPREAFARGIAVIYQHFSVIPSLSVVDNIFLGNEMTSRGRVNRREQQRTTVRLLESLGADIDPRTLVAHLSVGERQLVEIAKVMRREPEVLVLDEPTAALSDQESRKLSERLTALRDREGVGIVYVSHLLNEVFELVDSVTVLRDGVVALDAPDLAGVRPQDVIAAIAPTFDTSRIRRAEQSTDTRPPGLEVRELATSFVGPLSLSVRQGERVALFGLLGSGRTETLETIFGVRARRAGTIELNGVDHRPRNPSASIASGVAFVPGDRKERGVFSPLSAGVNVLLPHMRTMSKWWGRNFTCERATFDSAARAVNLTPPNAGVAASSFSGGNQQKLVIGRWIGDCADTRLLLLDEPTQGIDIGARSDVYDVLDRVSRDRDVAVLFATSDPDEAMQLADRIVVLSRGNLVLDTRPTDTSVDQILHAAHGFAVMVNSEEARPR